MLNINALKKKEDKFAGKIGVCISIIHHIKLNFTKKKSGNEEDNICPLSYWQPDNYTILILDQSHLY